MPTYIKRSVLNDFFNKMIEGYECCPDKYDTALTIKGASYGLPAADVVEVVRCKDCTRLVQKNGKLWCDGRMVLPFHYCSYGKKEG